MTDHTPNQLRNDIEKCPDRSDKINIENYLLEQERLAPIGRRIVKKSAGVACCRYNSERSCYEILMVRKRYTYGFAAFVFGQYNKNCENRLVALFDTMTISEKLDILSFRFDIMWWRIWLTFPDAVKCINNDDEWLSIYRKKTISNFIHSSPPKSKQELYIKKKAKFESAFLQDNGERLERILRRSKKSAELIWEIPKGRISKSETKLDCAIREFKEEVGVGIDCYDIVFDVAPFVESFTHMGVTYCNSYYIGLASRQFEPTISFRDQTQVIEIDAVKWIGVDELRYMNRNTHASNYLSKIFKIIKNRCKHIKENDTI